MPTATERKSTERITQAHFSSAEKQSLRRRLLAWYHKHARDLPWRRSRDPYRVWISEIMLQQTQVATVRDYFTRFIAAFPDIRSLADANEIDVLRLWEGLGYYRRARQLHAAAKQVVEIHSGKFPHDLVELQSLPGIGRYTAGAIASIAFDQHAPILEANTIRLFSRLLAFTGEATSAAGQSTLWRFAEEILPQKDVAHFNQALMELGSLVCTPIEPLCDQCPLATLCKANKLQLQHAIPAAKPRPAFTHLREAAIILSQSGGARMQESLLSLMQMAKTSAVLARLRKEGIPFISILTNPTTGGVTASYATLGDLNIAEPGALIGFAGPRVIKQTIGGDLPPGFQSSEFLLEHGMVDLICERKNLKSTLETVLLWFTDGRDVSVQRPPRG